MSVQIIKLHKVMSGLVKIDGSLGEGVSNFKKFEYLYGVLFL